MTRRFATPRSAAGVVAICVATAVGGFALGRATPRQRPAPPPEELAASLRAALGEGDALERLQRSTVLLAQMQPDNLVEVAALYDQMRPVLEDWELRPFVAAWARLDPDGAFEHALGWPARGMRDVGAEAALETWATLDPAGARQAFEQASAQHPGLRAKLLRGLVIGWARSGSGLEGLDGFIVKTGHEEDAIGAVVRELMRSGGPDATLAWVDPILRDKSDRPRFKRPLFRISLRAFARWDPEGAAAWAAQHVGNDYAEGGPIVVAGQWGGRDGAAAMAWLRELPAGEPRDRGVHRAFNRWFRADPVAATAWLDSEAPDGFRAPALEAYAQARVKEAPEEALGWCERIPDPEGAGLCLQDVASRWYRQDATAAEAWLQQSSLDEAARSAVRKPRRQRGQGESRQRGARSR